MLHAYDVDPVVEHATTVPAMVQVTPPPGAFTVEQMPGVVVLPLHLPPQHCVLSVQVSPFCLQYDVAVLQTLLMQPFEQHCESELQVLPDAKHEFVLFVAQKPPEHLPEQHWFAVVHAVPMLRHAPERQVPAEPHEPEQHWSFVVQVPPVVWHGPFRLPHWFGL